jgi:hypothetical protein
MGCGRPTGHGEPDTLEAVLMPERHITVQRRMSSSTGSVWALFADFPNLASHRGGLRATRAIGDQTSGVGARRHVELKPIGSMDETVTVWEDGRRIETRNRPSASVPFRHAETSLTLEPDAGRHVGHVRLPVHTQGRPTRPIDRPADRQDADRDLHRHAGRHRRGALGERVASTELLCFRAPAHGAESASHRRVSASVCASAPNSAVSA